MTTLRESKERFLLQLRIKAHSNIPGSVYTDGKYRKAFRRLMEIHTIVSALPLSNHIFEWYRKCADRVHIELIEDSVRIYRIEGQQIEQLEFVEGDICSLIYSALENKN